MTVNRLIKCKTLDDFNDFSKDITVDAKSGGRSFVYTNPQSGKTRSYTMNQIVHQFDKCIEKSKKIATTNLCDEVNVGLDAIDGWNANADKRTNSSLLSFRKWVGNGWYSFTHSGKDKDKTLAKIKAAYPKALANLPPIPQDMITIVMSNLNGSESDMAAFAGVNKASHAEAQKIEAENDAIIAKYGIFGRKQWQALGVKIGNVPVLPDGMEAIMESDCPIWAGKKVGDTHMLVLMPETVNGKSLSLNSLVKIAKNAFLPDSGYCYYIQTDIVKDIGDTPLGKSYWVLMTKEPIAGSLGESYIDQQTRVTNLSASSSLHYEVPYVLEAAVCALTQFIKDGTRLFEDTTRCQEKAQGYEISVGGMAPIVLSVRIDDNDDIGVAARRQF